MFYFKSVCNVNVWLLITFTLNIGIGINAQENYNIIDLQKELNSNNRRYLNMKDLDSYRVKIYISLSQFFSNNPKKDVLDFNQIEKTVYSPILLAINNSINSEQILLLEAHTYEIIGILYSRNEEDYPLALYYFQKALNTYNKIPKEYPKGLCFVYYDLSLCAYLMQDYPQANHYASLLKSHSEAIRDSLSIARYWKIGGLIHLEQGDYAQAKAFLEKSMAYNLSKNILLEYADELNNLAEVYQMQKQYLIADSLLHQALHIFESEKIMEGKPYLYETYNDIGELLAAQGKYQAAIYYSHKADSIRVRSKGLHADHFKEKIMRNLYLSYKNIGEYQEALKAMEQVDTLQGKLYGVEREKYKRLMDLRIDTETKEHQKEAAYQRVIALTAGSVALLAVLLVIVLWLNNRQKQKTNLKLQKQRDEISKAKDIIEQKSEALQIANVLLEEQKKEVEIKNEEIEDSIIYAKRIQDAILPFEERIARSLEEFFIFYRPRDIVSGDFYYFNQKKNKIVLAAVDCTGHGVPGAFMSMIASEILNEIINNKNILDAAQILHEINKSIKHAFKFGTQEINDGMDIALLIIDKPNKVVEFAGSQMPLVYIQCNELKVIKGAPYHIGGEKAATTNVFTSHHISISKPTTFYLYSDGFQDQFGGIKGKKYMTNNFRNYLYSIHHLPMEIQKEKLQEELKNWQGNLRQIDDILVIGVRL